ncbi:MAG: RCC1 domain-containing protein, partial [Proteobacteria bacterium]|nr:RCC1 domain-containing protein [Pseudomonadota bacterium]
MLEKIREKYHVKLSMTELCITVFLAGFVASCGFLNMKHSGPNASDNNKTNVSQSDSKVNADSANVDIDRPIEGESPDSSSTRSGHSVVGVRSNDSTNLEWAISKRIPLNVAYGKTHSCEIVERKVFCWGKANKATLPPDGLENVIQIVAGNDFSCALSDFGKVACWGENISIPESPQLHSATRMWANYSTLCVQGNDGISCFGNVQKSTPNNVRATQVALGSKHVCALTNKNVECWGDDKYKQLQTPNFRNPVQIDAYENDSCALDVNGVRCWGEGRVKEKPFVGSIFGGPQVEVSPEQISFMSGSICGVVKKSLQCPDARLEFPKVNIETDLLNIYSFRMSGVICVQDTYRT